MSTYTYLDRDAYLKAQKIIYGVDQTLSNTYLVLKGGSFRALQDNHDYYGELAQAMSEFVTAKRRLSNLHDAMSDYLALWDDAQQRANSRGNSIEVTADRYSDQVFWNLYTDRVLEGTGSFENSKAWQYVKNGGSFGADYGDFQKFRWQSGHWPEGALWARDIGSWRKNFVKGVVNPDLYYEPKLNAALEGMLKGLPGYGELDTVNTDIIDWDAMGEKVGVPGLKELVEKLASVAEQSGEKMGEADMEEVNTLIQELYYQCEGNPAMQKVLQAIGAGFEALPKGLQGAGKLVDKVTKYQEFSEFALKLILHSVSDHSQQIEYLQNCKEALLAAGYDDKGIVENLSYLEVLYSDNSLYCWQKVYDKAKEMGIDLADKAVGSLPVVKGVDLTYSLVGTAANIVAGDQLKAADSLMGIMQYEGALTETFDRYAKLIEAGVATQEDITRADQLFDMICTSKITGYQNMMTIIGDKQDPGYIMAETKMKELQEMLKK